MYCLCDLSVYFFIDRGITCKRDLTACQNMVSMYILFKNEIMKNHDHQLMAQEEWLMAHQHGLYIYNVYNPVEKSMFAKVVIKPMPWLHGQQVHCLWFRVEIINRRHHE